MNKKLDAFSHGFGAEMRALAVLKYKLTVVLACTAFGAIVAMAITWFGHSISEGAVAGFVAASFWYPQSRAIVKKFFGDRVRLSLTGFRLWLIIVTSCAMVGALVGAILAWTGHETVVGSLVGLFASPLKLRKIVLRGDEVVGDKHIRGAEMKSEEELADLAMEAAKAKGECGPFVHIGGVPIPRDAENTNFLIAGTMGSGKTTAMRQLLDVAEERGDSVVVHDPSGDLVGTYYRPERGDAILNSYDARAAEWDLFADTQTRADAQVIAECIAQPKPGEHVTEWLGYLREYIADATWVLKDSGRGTSENLLRTLGYGSSQELADLVDDTPSRRFFVKGAERAASSVIFGLPYVLRVLTSLRYRPGTGGTFAWTKYVANIDRIEGPKPWVFLGSPARQFLLLRPLITAALDVAATHMLSLPPYHPTRRVWLVLDEFAMLPPMESVRNIMSQGRKYGTTGVLVIQDPGQLDEMYERAAKTLTGYANTQLFLRLPGGPAARWACEQFGKHEKERRTANDTYDTEESHARSNVSVTREVRDLVLDSEIAGLHSLHGYLRVPNVGIGRVVIPTEHLSRLRGPALEPVDQSELWLAHLPGLRVAAGDVSGVPSDIADHNHDDLSF